MKDFLKWALVIVAAVVLIVAVYTKSTTVPEIPTEPTKSTPAQTTQPTEPSTEPTEPPTQVAPDFTVLDAEGNQVTLTDYKGKPIVLNFWATWCGYCKQEMPDFNLAAAAFPDVQFMMVNATDGERETMEKAKAYIAEQGFTFDVFYDTQLEAVNTYSVNAFPTTYFIDRDGNLIAYASGALDMASLEKGMELIQ